MQIKNCSVVLERMDDKLLFLYLQKYNKMKVVDFLKPSKIYSRTFSESSKKNKRKSKKSAEKNEFKRRKKIRVLSSDDDEASNETSFIKQTQNIIKKDEKTNKILNEVKNFKNLPDEENEIEVIKEIRKSCILEKNHIKHTEDNDTDFREDNEDDKITVIFEESPSKKLAVENFKNNISTVKAFENFTEKEIIRENYLKKLCSLVKRLHELFRIISQLQKNEPKNNKQSVQYSKVIKAQKMSFLREINMIQKPTIECYERLVTFYDNSNEVILKVSQLALLNLEDVSNIISRCILLGKFHQVQKNNETHQIKSFSGHFKKQSTGKKVMNASQSYSFHPPESVSYQYEIIPNVDESVIPMVIPAKKDLESIQKASLKSFIPSYDDYTQKQYIWAQQKYQVFHPGFKSPLQNDFRYPSVPDFPKCNIQLPNYNPQMYDFLVNSQKKPNLDFPPPEIPTHPLFIQQFYIPNYLQQKSGLEQSSFGSHQRNNSREGTLPFLSNVQKSTQHTLEDYLNDPIRFSKQNPYTRVDEVFGKQRLNETNLLIDARNNGNEALQETFDFAVPEYVPVKNCQIQKSTAGKKTEVSRESNRIQTFSETEDRSALRKGNSNFRIYICAQSNCKMPGILICKGCQSVIYCSETCQFKHWTLKHKTECYQLRELRIA